MTMTLLLNTITIVITILLILTILIQQRGSGIGGAFGGDSAVYRTRRGAERFIFRLTIVLALLFVASAIANIYL